MQDRVRGLGGGGGLLKGVAGKMFVRNAIARVESFLFTRNTLCMAFIFIDDRDLSYNDVLGCKGKNIHLIIRTSYNFYSKSTTRLESCRIAYTAGFSATTAHGDVENHLIWTSMESMSLRSVSSTRALRSKRSPSNNRKTSFSAPIP